MSKGYEKEGTGCRIPIERSGRKRQEMVDDDKWKRLTSTRRRPLSGKLADGQTNGRRLNVNNEGEKEK